MKVQVSDSFFKSLRVLIWHESPVYKVWKLFRYDLPGFFKNIWRFRKPLWHFSWWDYRYTLDMLECSLSVMERGMRNKGLEVPETRDPKLKSMARALEILRNNKESNYIERAEDELGHLVIHDWEFEDLGNGTSRLIDRETPEEKAHNRKVFERAREIEDLEWKELWEIFKGTKNSKSYGKKYDGTDMRSWWD